MTTSAQRQTAFRKRNAELGRSELRGIMATKEEQVILKREMRALLKTLRK